MKKVYIYKGFERFWHWTQACLIMFLALTGFEVHGSLHIFGFEKAVEFHRTASYLLIGLIILAIFWHFTTGEWKQYIPTLKNLKAQIRYYLIGIFKNEKHPTHKTELSKMNPLQRLVYLGFKLVLVPLTIISGLLYMYHKTIDKNDIVVISKFNLGSIATWHTIGAFLLMVFLVIHVYMTTTGNRPTSNIKAMITGYEDIEDEEGDDKNKSTTDELKTEL
ncbi:MAG: cytochrome b/b6 domain-containing protein [Bacteroidales bacterium]|nr:cytochrome b/b6 domain-containing protein [Bacteroidales bacterium]